MSTISFQQFAAYSQIKHVITTRKGGYSPTPFDSLNLSLKVNDNAEHVIANRQQVKEWLGSSILIFPEQTHSDHIEIVNSKNVSGIFQDTDALITNEKNIAIGVMSADCVPILLYDPVQHVVAAIHAGWKGTVNGIVLKTIQKMQQEFNVNPSDILAGIGPSICSKCYEIGTDVIQQIQEKCIDSSLILKHLTTSKAFADLQEANRQWILHTGVSPENIEVMERCTFEEELFFSARKSDYQTGRFSACIVLK